jgi:hypothetical protein
MNETPSNENQPPVDDLSSPLADDFPSMDQLKVSAEGLDGIKAAQIITSLPVGKPPRSSFFRTHPDPAFWFPTAILTLEETREIFLVMPAAMVHTMGLARSCHIVPYITVTGQCGLWPIKAGANAWNDSARDAAARARDNWVRLGTGQGQYDVFVAQAALPAPSWPNLTATDYLKAGFKHRLIRDNTHEVVRKLAGEIS